MARSIQNQMKPGQGRAYSEILGGDEEKEPFKVHDFSNYSISGFKAFGMNSARVQIKPLTIVFGPNSSGKSSLIHSLLYLNEVARTGEVDVRKPWIAGGMIDLGGWLQCHNNNRTFGRMDFNLGFENPGQKVAAIWKKKPKSYSYGFGIQLMESIQSVADLWTNSLFFIEHEAILEAKGSGKTGGWASYVDHLEESEWNVWRDILHRYSLVPKSVKYNEDELNTCPVQIKYEEIVESLDWIGSTCLDSVCLSGHTGKNSALSTHLADYVGFVTRRIWSLLSSIEYHGPFREYRTRESLVLTTTIGARSTSMDALEDPLEILLLKPEVRYRVNKWLKDCRALETNYKLVRRKYLRIDQMLDKMLPLIHSMGNGEKAEYEASSYTNQKAAENKLWNDPDLVDIARQVLLMLEALSLATSGKTPEPTEEIAKAITLDLVESVEMTGYDQLAVFDEAAERDGSFRDIGVGLSQVLPLVISACAAQNKLLLMEQPELHIHPALQADLADVFIDSAIGEGQNTIVLETHSEHLLLRVLRRIRETSQGRLPDGHPKLRPEDVSVVYIEKGEDGSKVIPIPLTEEGDFAVPWPKGFFPERGRELF